ncbi:MAG: hypothetical protein ACRERV_00110 [Methylococcales bacterium]
MSKSAVSQARQKLKASAFEALNDSLVGLLNELLPEPRWCGLRLVAADSTTLRLPPWLENQAEFGVQTDTGGQPYVLARALGLFATAVQSQTVACSDPSKLMLKTVLGRFDDAERVLLTQLLPHLDQNDLLVLDRGFPAVWLFTLLQQRQLPFLARRQMAIKAAGGATLSALRFDRNRSDVSSIGQGVPSSTSSRNHLDCQNADPASGSSRIGEWSY